MVSTFSPDEAFAQYRRDITAQSSRKADASTEQQNLVESHLALVIHIARRYEGRGVDLMDLIQEGNLSLLRAAQKFDPTRDLQFSTYAAFWIRQGIFSALSQHSLSVSRYKRERLQRLRSLQRQMQEAGDEPTFALLAQRMETSEASVLRMVALQQTHAVSLDAQTGEHEEDTLANVLEANPDHAPEHVAFLKVRNEQLTHMLTLLTKAERQVILLRYGVLDGEEHTYDEIERRTRLGQRKIHSLEQRALLKMRRLAHLQQLHDFVD